MMLVIRGKIVIMTHIFNGIKSINVICNENESILLHWNSIIFICFQMKCWTFCWVSKTFTNQTIDIYLILLQLQRFQNLLFICWTLIIHMYEHPEHIEHVDAVIWHDKRHTNYVGGCCYCCWFLTFRLNEYFFISVQFWSVAHIYSRVLIKWIMSVTNILIIIIEIVLNSHYYCYFACLQCMTVNDCASTKKQIHELC